MTIGRVIRQLREERGWTQGQLAQYTGVSRSYISQIEGGQRLRPSADILKSLAAKLDTSVDLILLKAEGKPIDDELTQQALSLFRRLPTWRQREELERLRLAVEIAEKTDYRIMPQE